MHIVLILRTRVDSLSLNSFLCPAKLTLSYWKNFVLLVALFLLVILTSSVTFNSDGFCKLLFGFSSVHSPVKRHIYCVNVFLLEYNSN